MDMVRGVSKPCEAGENMCDMLEFQMYRGSVCFAVRFIDARAATLWFARLRKR